MNAVELLPDQALSFHTQEGEVVQGAVRRWFRDGIELDVWVDSGDDLVWLGDLQKGIVEPDLDAREIKGVVAELDRLAVQVSRDAVAIATERKGACLGDFARFAVQKSLAWLVRVGGTGRGSRVLAMSFERGLTSL